MPKFRKRPIVIEARKFIEPIAPDGPSQQDLAELLRWGGKDLVYVVRGGACIQIFTLDAVAFALDGDWIIKGVKGEFYPCKPDVFDATYEAVEE